MTCATCEKVRRFFRNGVQRIAPFTEYEDEFGNVFIIANDRIVGDNSSNSTFVGATFHTTNQDNAYAIIKFPDGQAMGVPVKQTRKLFSNPYR